MIQTNEIIFYIIFFIGFISSILSMFFSSITINKYKSKFLNCVLTYKCDDYTGDLFWSGTHFLLYFIFGLFIPNRWKLIIISIILWELYEIILSIKLKWYDETIHRKISNIISDLLGYCLGMFILTCLH
jgi:phosphatidylglycerophosphatase A